MPNPIAAAVKYVGRTYNRMITGREYRRQQFICRERFVEYRFAFEALAELCPRTVLDVGTGVSSFPHLVSTNNVLVTAVDIHKPLSAGNYFNRHFHMIQDDITQAKLTETYDAATCISVLEHIPEYGKAIDNFYRLLNPGGALILTVPYNEKQFIENAYKLPQSTAPKTVGFELCRQYSREQLDQWLEGRDWEISRMEYWRIWSGEFWATGERIHPPEKTSKDGPHQLACILFRRKM